MKTNQCPSTFFKVVISFTLSLILILNACMIFAQDIALANAKIPTHEYLSKMESKMSNFEKGMDRLESGEPGEAIAYFNRAAKENPANAVICDKLGQAYAKTKEYRKAIEHFDKAIALDNTNPVFYYDKALAEIYLDKIEKSISDCDRAILLDPAYAEAYLVRGISKAVLGEIEGSMQDLRLAISLKNDYGEAYYNIGLNFYELRDDANARFNFKRASELGYNIQDLENYLDKE